MFEGNRWWASGRLHCNAYTKQPLLQSRFWSGPSLATARWLLLDVVAVVVASSGLALTGYLISARAPSDPPPPTQLSTETGNSPEQTHYWQPSRHHHASKYDNFIFLYPHQTHIFVFHQIMTNFRRERGDYEGGHINITWCIEMSPGIFVRSCCLQMS